jgi:hypothetical protein
MMKSGFARRAAFMVLLAGISAVGAYAQITISGGFALSTMEVKPEGYSSESSFKGDIGLGGNVYLDYLLPVGIPVSLGGEIGIDTSSISSGGVTGTMLAVPILLRAAYHFDLFPKLDLYLVGKIGYTIGSVVEGFLKDYVESAGGIAFGIDVGVAYYFASALGAFIEGGFDDYAVEAKIKNNYGGGKLETPFYRYITFGLSFKK